MTAQRLSPAMRNVLHAVITRGHAPQRNPAKTAPTLQALHQRGLLDASNQPTQAGRDVFAHPQPRRPGIDAVYVRVRAERPNWSDAHVAAHAKYLYTTKGVRC